MVAGASFSISSMYLIPIFIEHSKQREYSFLIMSDISSQIDVKMTLKVPSMWKVVIHNDDYTPVEFVVALIHKIFDKSIEDATKLTYAVHNNGKAIVGIYTKEIAMTKISLVRENADNFGHPLLATAEEV